MCEGNAKIWIIDAVKDFIGENKEGPTTVRISTDIAHDLMKLGRNDIGEELIDAFCKNGIAALKGRKLFGYNIVVDADEEDISCD